MIRIKCPKCDTSLSLNDDLAGGVGECSECGAKFRVPSPKAKAASRASRDEDDDDDYDDDEDDDDEDEEARAARRRRYEEDEEDEDEDQRRPPQKQGSVVGTLITLGVLFVVIVITGIAGIFLKNIGVTVFFGSVLAALTCAIMVVRAATKEGGTLAFVCVVIAILMAGNGLGVTMMFFGILLETDMRYPFKLILFFGPLFWSAFLGIHVASNWKDNGRFGMVWLFCVILAGVAFVATLINQGRIDAFRQQVRARHNLVMVAPSPPLHHAGQRG
jgi:hypothetical protein